MQNILNIKHFNTYLLFPVIICALCTLFLELFILVGFLEFIIGALQLVWSISISLSIIFTKSHFHNELKIYWKMVFTYGVIYILLVNFLNYSIEMERDTILSITFSYSCLAISIAIYHFKHIIFLKPKKNEN